MSFSLLRFFGGNLDSIVSTRSKRYVIEKARIIDLMGRAPFLGAGLRRLERRYPEGSIVTIKNGHLAGYRWKRSHRYVSGYWLGIYELAVQKCLARELGPEDVFYDIGANAGFFSLLGSKCVGNKGHVFAFEPLPQNVETIRSQLGLNNITNCTVVEAALSDSSGQVEFCEGPDTSTAHIRHAGHNSQAANIVRTITLDEYTITGRSPDFIKIDIEGAEVIALKGARRLLRSEKPPTFLIELHGETTAQEVREILEGEGYCLCTLERTKIDPRYMPLHVLAVSETSLA